MSEFGLRAISGVGYFVLLGAAWLLSNNRGAINRRTVTSGVAIQLVLALALLASPLRELWVLAAVDLPSVKNEKKTHSRRLVWRAQAASFGEHGACIKWDAAESRGNPPRLASAGRLVWRARSLH